MTDNSRGALVSKELKVIASTITAIASPIGWFLMSHFDADHVIPDYIIHALMVIFVVSSLMAIYFWTKIIYNWWGNRGGLAMDNAPRHSHVNIENSNFEGNRVGIRIRGESTVNLKNTPLKDNDIGIDIVKK